MTEKLNVKLFLLKILCPYQLPIPIVANAHWKNVVGRIFCEEKSENELRTLRDYCQSAEEPTITSENNVLMRNVELILINGLFDCVRVGINSSLSRIARMGGGGSGSKGGTFLHWRNKKFSLFSSSKGFKNL